MARPRKNEWASLRGLMTVLPAVGCDLVGSPQHAHHALLVRPNYLGNFDRYRVIFIREPTTKAVKQVLSMAETESVAVLPMSPGPCARTSLRLAPRARYHDVQSRSPGSLLCRPQLPSCGPGAIAPAWLSPHKDRAGPGSPGGPLQPVGCNYPSAGCRGCAREPSSVDTGHCLSRAAI